MTIYIFVSRKQKHVRVVYRDRNSDDVVEDHKPAVIRKRGGSIDIKPIKKSKDNSEDKIAEPTLTVPTSRTIIKYVESLN